MGSVDPVNLNVLKNELHDIRSNKLYTNINTTYQDTQYEFDKIEFAITTNLITLENIEYSDVTWYSNLASSDVENLVQGDGTYRLWVRVYNEYEIPAPFGPSTKKPIEIGYGYVDYVVDNTAPIVTVSGKELIYEDKELDLLSDEFITTNEDKENLDIKVTVNGVVI